jgi:prolycopene isomerase
MSPHDLKRREFIKSLLATLSIGALDWSAFPFGTRTKTNENEFDAIIIGSGLGGLSCAAAFARQRFKPLVLEQHSKPGGYATTFERQGFVFDVSLHSTGVGERNGVHNLIPGFPEITDVEFVPHPILYRAIFPDYDIRVPQKNVRQYIETLIGYFPDEKEGIEGIFEDMRGLLTDVRKISAARGQVDMSRFAEEYPSLFTNAGKTWGQMVDARLKNPKLKAIVSSLWGYYGLPPSRLSPFYYAVKTENGEEFTARAVISNASAHETFNKMLGEPEFLKDYLAQLEKYSVSLSSFQVFLGLKKDLIGEVGIKDTEIFFNPGYDPDEDYRHMLEADVSGGFGLTLYDNLYRGYSPEGKNTLNILTLQGYDHWKPYEIDYFKGNKAAYRAEKERMANILIDEVEKALLPGLRKAIEVIEIGTPLTNVRYTSNYRGAVYGWDQTLNNSGQTRLSQKTPVKNLYLAGAWTRPGHGYGAVIPSGLQCFAQIMSEW